MSQIPDSSKSNAPLEVQQLPKPDNAKFAHFGTAAVHAGFDPCQHQGWPLALPISLGTTFKQADPEHHQDFTYSRTDNPTRSSLEKNLAALENAKYCRTYSSGLGALTSLVAATLAVGDHVVCTEDAYGGTIRFLRTVACNFGITYTLVDVRNTSDFVAAIGEKTKMVIVESPSNPLMRITDIPACSELARKQRPASPPIFVVDNTFASPFAQRPLELGADVSWHSCTKYLGGHSDVVMGALFTNNDQLAEKLAYEQKAIGAVPSPFDCYLLWRGIKTLHIRVQRQAENAQQIAAFLSTHPLIERVFYPGLTSHPEHELAKKQMRSFSGMLSFNFVSAVNSELLRVFLNQLKIFTLAESLGAVESLIEIPGLMTHTSLPVELRAKLGINERLVRVSVGVEEVEDLIEDLRLALSAVAEKLHT